MKKISFCIFSFILLIFFIGFNKVHGIECDFNTNISGLNETDLREYSRKCEEKRNQASQKRNTLQGEINYMDSQIYLTSVKIQETQKKITSTEKEIDVLGSRIEGLDQSLDLLSKLLLDKIIQSYKQREVSLFGLLFDSQSAGDLLSKIKYMKTARDNNQKLLVQVQEAKSNFEEQKKLREEKKVELDNLTQTLNEQSAALDNQKVQKQKLLTDTKNDEANYQRLISQAQAQLAGFKSFVSTTGASSIIAANQFGNGSDGSYYSQRDARWANQAIGYSSESILDVGCLLTSVAMVGKRYGGNTSPSDIAGDSSRFFANTAYMRLPWPGVAGRSYNSIGTDDSSITQELNNGNYVIVGVGGCSSGGSHFVVLTKKDGSDYIMHDPIYGPDLKFSSHYGNICSAATFK